MAGTTIHCRCGVHRGTVMQGNYAFKTQITKRIGLSKLFVPKMHASAAASAGYYGENEESKKVVGSKKVGAAALFEMMWHDTMENGTGGEGMIAQVDKVIRSGGPAAGLGKLAEMVAVQGDARKEYGEGENNIKVLKNMHDVKSDREEDDFVHGKSVNKGPGAPRFRSALEHASYLTNESAMKDRL
eukprot:jgi/Picsp_1/2732/NSC_00960-R1_---NA---